MSRGDPDAFVDSAAGRLIRPYAVAGGRTAPNADFHLVTYVVATGRALSDLGPDHDDILSLCDRPISVAEVSALSGLPLAVTKILLSDLLGWRAIDTRAPVPVFERARPSTDLLEKVLDALYKL
ncbi:protein of unknown function DUF742 [Catenulispora acidiphila DSM 44928]|uniref:DUF742 domain-containing protein n=1 Tax=Catenulispora acidiphila (strain DSM 44928 / JCM 14897 / NBRC 102108 / NRRL B-24433 / ID139908) TaxID=479433 RepID=C7PVG2_CATAD|nr:DUF742 domain-containing protein [Catenulispora acidiphila]ACU69318.1 protein of unknown function DUF742 [Catenulispora acidiphila DSM 44928]